MAMARWTDAEDAILLSARGAGMLWNAVTALLPGRTTKGVKDRWGRVLKHRPAGIAAAAAFAQAGTAPTVAVPVTAQPQTLHTAAHPGNSQAQASTNAQPSNFPTQDGLPERDDNLGQSLVTLTESRFIADPAELHAAAERGFVGSPDTQFSNEVEVHQFIDEKDEELIRFKENYGNGGTSTDANISAYQSERAAAAVDPVMIDPALTAPMNPIVIDSDDPRTWPAYDHTVMTPGLHLQVPPPPSSQSNSDEDTQANPPFTPTELNQLVAFVSATGLQKLRDEGYWELLSILFFQTREPSQLRAAYEKRLADTQHMPQSANTLKPWTDAEDSSLQHMTRKDRAIAEDGSIDFTHIGIALGRSPASCEARCRFLEHAEAFEGGDTPPSSATPSVAQALDQFVDLYSPRETGASPSPSGFTSELDAASIANGSTDLDSGYGSPAPWMSEKRAGKQVARSSPLASGDTTDRFSSEDPDPGLQHRQQWAKPASSREHCKPKTACASAFADGIEMHRKPFVLKATKLSVKKR